VAPPVRAGRSQILCGTSSWADRSLVRDGAFYPRKTMTATERLAYYASQLPLAEIATTYRFPPTAEVARQWVDRTPPGFVFDVRCWSLLTEAPTLPDSLWEDLRQEVRPEVRHRRRLYAAHLSPDAVEECWRRFEHALSPLAEAQRLGAVILQYPPWWTPKEETRLELAQARARLSAYRIAVEFHNPRWFEGDTCEETLEWLEETGLALVCVDGPAAGPRAMPLVVAATSEFALVRFTGRREDPEDAWPYPYRYREAELAEWVPRIGELAGSASEVHVVMANSWRGDAVDNARALARLVAQASASSPPPPPGSTSMGADTTEP
jgi:uncharacterized protein YecE (DUF72 family)